MCLTAESGENYPLLYPLKLRGSLLIPGLVYAVDPAEGLRQRLSRRCAYGPTAIQSISMQGGPSIHFQDSFIGLLEYHFSKHA